MKRDRETLSSGVLLNVFFSNYKSQKKIREPSMAEIKNPWHSRPLDVHRWSEHPEVKSLVDNIWDEYVEETVPEKGPGPKPKLA